ncbi:STAS/SEC14 domain-containing protein [Saprospira grandis]|uniref:DUF7793 family protein n=1 Tax=Saprospira grandis TaxID=1008 RepID=UPI0022DE52FB|nr:STAS/SEC14 domain-containing protein [Saprospira grandis]WBM75092.1 STAS/SEC14 domain-containing protein [Saprospira grandis]
MKRKLGQSEQLEYWLRANGIFEIAPSSNSGRTKEISLEEALITVDMQKALFEETGKKVRVLANLSNVSKAARDYGKTEEGQAIKRYVLAYALIAPNLFGRLIGNMLVGTFQTDYPVKLFSSEEKAEEWLLSLED